MNPVRSALYGGIFYTLPLLLWLLGGLQGLTIAEAVRTLLREGFAILIPVQCLVVAVFVPPLRRRKPSEALIAAGLLVALPWPVLAMFWLGTDIGLLTILSSQISIVAWAGLLLLTARVRIPRIGPLPPSLLQVGGLLLTLFASSPWLAWSLSL